MRFEELVPARATRLLDGLKDLFAHLRGAKRLDFRRLFLATSNGSRCKEMDRYGFRPSKPKHVFTNKQDGFWLPAWMWPIITDILRQDHLVKVRAGDESRVSAALLPPGARKDPELLGPTEISRYRGFMKNALEEFLKRKTLDKLEETFHGE